MNVLALNLALDRARRAVMQRLCARPAQPGAAMRAIASSMAPKSAVTHQIERARSQAAVA